MVIGHWSLVIGHWSFVIRHSSFVIRHSCARPKPRGCGHHCCNWSLGLLTCSVPFLKPHANYLHKEYKSMEHFTEENLGKTSVSMPSTVPQLLHRECQWSVVRCCGQRTTYNGQNICKNQNPMQKYSSRILGNTSVFSSPISAQCRHSARDRPTRRFSPRSSQRHEAAVM